MLHWRSQDVLLQQPDRVSGALTVRSQDEGTAMILMRHVPAERALHIAKGEIDRDAAVVQRFQGGLAIVGRVDATATVECAGLIEKHRYSVTGVSIDGHVPNIVLKISGGMDKEYIRTGILPAS